MTYNTGTLLIICGLYGVFVIIAGIKLWNKDISTKNLLLFLRLVILAAGLRFGLLLYLLAHPIHYYNVMGQSLSILLNPEIFFSQQIMSRTMLAALSEPTPVYNHPLFWVINVSLFILGSFLWLFPILLFFADKKPVKMK